MSEKIAVVPSQQGPITVTLYAGPNFNRGVQLTLSRPRDFMQFDAHELRMLIEALQLALKHQGATS